MRESVCVCLSVVLGGVGYVGGWFICYLPQTEQIPLATVDPAGSCERVPLDEVPAAQISLADLAVYLRTIFVLVDDSTAILVGTQAFLGFSGRVFHFPLPALFFFAA